MGKEEKEQQEAFSLEKAFEQLEETIEQLEQEDVSLEKSFEIYQAGMKLLKKCNGGEAGTCTTGGWNDL